MYSHYTAIVRFDSVSAQDKCVMIKSEVDQRASIDDAARARAGGLAFMLRALGHRNYRLFFSGQSISLVGTWMTRIATSWLVYRLTGSELLLGVAGFAGQIPSFLLAPFAGVLVDRRKRQRLLR